MGRSKLAEGKRGEPKAYEDATRKAAGKPDYWRGVCPWRGVGMPNPKNAQAYRETAAKAKRAASDKADENLKEWKPTDGTLDPNITVFELCDLWIERHEKISGIRGQSIGYYKRIIYRAVQRPKPGVVKIEGSTLGNMKAVTVLTSHIDAHVDLVRHTPAVAKNHRIVLREAFRLLVKSGLKEYNPVNESDVVKIVRPEPKPFTPAQYARYLELETAYFIKRPNANRERYADTRQLMYDIVGRPGEALAVRKEDVDTKAGVVSVTGTIVTSDATGKRCKAFRQDIPKTDESVRYVKVSAPTAAMLNRRILAMPTGQELIFVTRDGNPIAPGDFNETWGKIVEGSELDWSTPKAIRKTAFKRIDEKHGEAAAQAAGGHRKGSRVTRDHYTGKDIVVTDFTDALHG
ncbi:tyrosine-type recombinase/integrase [Nocardia sp. NPDC058519]|uniref:tyrosine-type recombinase/integrase n=1 Tax=Nocardia sp. NPDC058519 TaxID=3346535 RepID=UPI00366527F7